MPQQTYPGVIFNIQDNSAGSTPSPQQTPLHMPCFFIFAESGPIGTPVYGTYAQHAATFGVRTFDETAPFFQHPSIFAKTALQYQPAFLIRLADATVTTAGLVLEAIVTQEQITQYQLNPDGSQMLDSTGNPIPQQTGGVNVTQPGVSITFQTRALLSTETFDTLTTTTTTSGSNTVTTYPILATYGNSPGSGVNRSGFSIYYTPNYDATEVAAINSMTYRFAPVTLLPNTTGTTTMLADIYGMTYNDVSFKTSAIDVSTNQDVSMNAILANNYTDANGNSLLNYSVFVYSANVQTIGAQIITLSPELDQTMDPFLINLLGGVDANGNPYQHFILNPNPSTVVNENVVLYNTGGTDGVLTKTNLETLTAAFCQSTSDPEFQDYFRFPITNFYDSGYSTTTKTAIMNLFALRDDIKIDFSTQDVANPPNTAAQDQSAGDSILGSILLYPESVLFGTDAIRASIYQQCGKLAAGSPVNYSGFVPCTLDRMIKRCIFANAPYIKGTPKGRPNSEVTIFKSISWSETSATAKQINWNTGLNTIGYADMQTLFYADLRSVYQNQTSLLSDDVFVDYLVYLKHIVRNRWTYYAGRSDPAKKLYTSIENAIDKDIAAAFGGRLPATTTVSQTALDQQLGYQTTVTVAVTGTLPDRIWNVIVPVSRTPA